LRGIRGPFTGIELPAIASNLAALGRGPDWSGFQSDSAKKAYMKVINKATTIRLLKKNYAEGH
jgi:hypothetical protein